MTGANREHGSHAKRTCRAQKEDVVFGCMLLRRRFSVKIDFERLASMGPMLLLLLKISYIQNLQ